MSAAPLSDAPAGRAVSIEPLLAHRAELLAFVERRVRDRAVAEDILQDALVKAMDRLDGLEKPESLLPWFYRLLRTTLIDAGRRTAARGRAFHAFGAEAPHAHEDEPRSKPCACVHDAIDSLKPDHADVLRRVAIDELPVKDYAAEVGISSGNAAVRSYRAREALREAVTHTCGACAADGCTDCTCARGR